MSPEEIKALAEVVERVPGIKGIDIKDVRRLAALLRESPEIGSIELRGWFGTGVVITRTQAPGAGAMMPMLPAMPAVALPAPLAGAAPEVGAGEAGRAPLAASALKEIKSPMVGTFYAAPEPGAEPYVKAGTRVAPGQTVCIIEAMKIMNEIEAEFGGVIREVCVDDAQPVEFGQVLFRVDPHG